MFAGCMKKYFSGTQESRKGIFRDRRQSCKGSSEGAREATKFQSRRIPPTIFQNIPAFLLSLDITAIRSAIVARKAVGRIRSTVSRDRRRFVSRYNGAPCLRRDCS